MGTLRAAIQLLWLYNSQKKIGGSMKRLLAICCIVQALSAIAGPYPLQFSIPEEKIVKKIPEKTRDFAYIVPRELNTYIYTKESDYYEDYQRSYFAITCAKGGWDCMRHYEILANGCIPYFIDLDQCHPETMAFLPKALIWEAMHLEGVSYQHIDHRVFNKRRYYEILEALLAHTREYLTSQKMAEYLLKTMGYEGNGKILFLSNETGPDYLRCCTLTGLKQALGDKIVDFPKIEHIYKSYPGDVGQLYGRGFSYTKIVEDLPVDRTAIEERIRQKEFDLVIYGSVHRGLRYHDLVRSVYSSDQIFYVCGEDAHRCEFAHWPQLFLREFDAK